MPFNPSIHHRHSIRLPGYEIINGKLFLNQNGNIVREKWQWLAEQYPHVDLDEFIVMPNHLHGILFKP